MDRNLRLYWGIATEQVVFGLLDLFSCLDQCDGGCRDFAVGVGLRCWPFIGTADHTFARAGQLREAA
jgi:hypothetical protein